LNFYGKLNSACKSGCACTCFQEPGVKTLQAKKAKLTALLSELDSLLVAFSGGVDSTYLLAVAHGVLGDRLLAVTAFSPVHPESEKKAALALVENMGVRHTLIPSGEMALPEFTRNPSDRCYHCKVHLFGGLLRLAEEKGLQYVAHGANLDDLNDYRPGLQAAREMGIKAPLMDAELTKADIRELAREMGLAVWDKPAMACLASRIPYGTTLTVEKLAMVEKAEKVLHELGFRHCRVRHHGSLARIEVPMAAFQAILEKKLATEIVSRLQTLGFLHISLDLEGYTQGSMNRAVPVGAHGAKNERYGAGVDP
jgi:uncharacterized protein